MLITLLGSGTGVPSSRRNPPGILIQSSNINLLFDSGPGTLKNMFNLGVNCLNLDFIFYTHLHLDHISDLASILFAARIPPSLRRKPLSVYGPSGLKDYYKKLNELYGYTISPESYKLELNEIENKEVTIDKLKIRSKILRHHEGGMGYRLTTPKGGVVVYSGDTGYCDEIIDLSKEADFLFLECSFPDEMKMKGHLTPKEVGKIAELARAKKLILIHMYPVCDKYDLIAQCKKEYSGDLIIGEDMMGFKLD